MCQYWFALAHVFRVWILASPIPLHKQGGKVVAQINTLASFAMCRRPTKPYKYSANESRNSMPKWEHEISVKPESDEIAQINLHKIRWP